MSKVFTFSRRLRNYCNGRYNKTGAGSGYESGRKRIMCCICSHTTAAVTINENTDPDVRDLLMEINKVIPFSDGYHHIEGNSAAHIKSSLMGFSETIIIDEGRLILGTWQGIYLTEYDGPRMRKVHVKIIEG